MVTPSPVLSLSNDLLTERDRFGWYVDRVREGIAPFTLTTPHARDFPARVMSADLGTAQLEPSPSRPWVPSAPGGTSGATIPRRIIWR